MPGLHKESGATECLSAGQLRHMEYTVRTLSCRNSFEDRDRGIFVPLFCGVGFCDLLWVYLEKNTDHTDAPNGAATRRSRLRRAAPAAATERCFLPLSKATTKRLRQQPAVRRERLVAAAEGCVCAVCVLFPNTLKAEPVPSLFISQHIQYYNQRRESRQEKPLLSLTRFFVCSPFPKHTKWKKPT